MLSRGRFISRAADRAIQTAVLFALGASLHGSAIANLGGIEAISGEWRGRGVAREFTSSAPEAVLCQASNIAQADQIQSTAICHAASGRVLLSTTIRLESGQYSGRYQRTLTARDTEERGTLSGNRARDGSFRFYLSLSNVVRAIVTLRLEEPSAYTLKVREETESGALLLDIRFTR